MKLQSLADKNVLVVGALGKTGLAMSSLLTKVGCHVFGADQKLDSNTSVTNMNWFDTSNLADSYQQNEIAAVFVSPGVPLTQPIFQQARKLNLPIVGDLDLGYLYLQESTETKPAILAITGTDGKSTTTALIAHLLREADIRTLECGNFGLPFSSAVLESTDVLVCECSSYQLEELHYFRPNVGLILNVAADHLDRYHSMADYIKAKLNLFKNQDRTFDRSIAGMGVKSVCDVLQLPLTVDLQIEEVSKQAVLTSFNVEWSEFAVNSETNRRNATLALAVIQELISISKNQNSNLSARLKSRLGLLETQKKIIEGLRSFRGLPHRQEIVTQKEGIVFINDSKATTVHSVL
ncbi:MAG: UDP-N-acetylmuramoyl-L-alanine--D-glutamate ligase, partial [Leptonema sp. (in: Bacteria)]|nr:UDP-N-acetylmuramoyl-L-alanine--D-glutamate ligase [Leptonema sp. (in: bacteria)]